MAKKTTDNIQRSVAFLNEFFYEEYKIIKYNS